MLMKPQAPDSAGKPVSKKVAEEPAWEYCHSHQLETRLKCKIEGDLSANVWLPLAKRRRPGMFLNKVPYSIVLTESRKRF